MIRKIDVIIYKKTETRTCEKQTIKPQLKSNVTKLPKAKPHGHLNRKHIGPHIVWSRMREIWYFRFIKKTPASEGWNESWGGVTEKSPCYLSFRIEIKSLLNIFFGSHSAFNCQSLGTWKKCSGKMLVKLKCYFMSAHTR